MTSAQVTWKPLRIGAGGWLTGIDISADGSTRVVRTDTYGAYILTTLAAQWQPLVTATSMPAGDATVDKNAGVYEIRIAPRTPTRLYMAYRGYIYRSNNSGGAWSLTSFSNVAMDPNDGYRMFGQKMAVDPANADVVYAGTPQNGLWVTTDGGTSWTQVTAVPASLAVSGGYPGITGIVFDPNSGTTGGKTNTVYAVSNGNGVYRTTNAGSSWSAMSGSPATAKHAQTSSDGYYYLVTNSGNVATQMYRWDGSVWTNITPPGNSQIYDVVTIDPSNATRLIAVREGGYLNQSHDRGASWDGIVWTMSRAATDVPWLAWTLETYMSVGDAAFDPLVANKLWFAEGIGVWSTILPVTTPGLVTWTSQSQGIEQLVANQILAPSGGMPMVASWDRAFFRVANPDVYPSTHLVDQSHAIVHGWALDYASTNTAFIAGLVDNFGPVEQSGYSTDGGQTWHVFSTVPAFSTPGAGTPIGGCIAASTPNNIVWVPSNKNAPYYTTNQGVTWTKISLPGVNDDSTATGWGNLHPAYYLRRYIVTADRVAATTFYLYLGAIGVFKSTDGGATWTKVFSGTLGGDGGFNTGKLRSVPGQSGHLFFTAGLESPPHPGNLPFLRSTDGGATWTNVNTNVKEVIDFGFGKAASGGSGYPAIFIAGWVNNVYGTWQSDDIGATWTNLTTWPINSLDAVVAVEGDKDVYGKVYLGFSGSGYAYGATGQPLASPASPKNLTVR
jgi:hypothetical protein